MNLEQQASITRDLGDLIQHCEVSFGEVTLTVDPIQLRALCLALRDNPAYQFNLLLDVCGVDFLEYGRSEWQTESATTTGFSRATEVKIEDEITEITWDKPRFGVVYHLLSLPKNTRIRLCSFIEGEPPVIDSVVDIWPAANWFEREAFDLFGIIFKGHPDLRRILTDYGFVGHPFRKDFPLIGQVEMRYDAALGRCVYEPVSIQPRVVIPKVIRQDNRYIAGADNG